MKTIKHFSDFQIKNIYFTDFIITDNNEFSFDLSSKNGILEEDDDDQVVSIVERLLENYNTEGIQVDLRVCECCNQVSVKKGYDIHSEMKKLKDFFLKSGLLLSSLKWDKENEEYYEDNNEFDDEDEDNNEFDEDEEEKLSPEFYIKKLFD